MEEDIKLYGNGWQWVGNGGNGDGAEWHGNGDGAEWHKSVNKVNPLKFT